MKNKIWMTILLLCGALYALGNAGIVLNFPDIHITSLEDKFSSVDFMTPGNNFGGSIFWLPTKSVSPMYITLGTNHKTCTKLVRGLYFNSQRGKRIWPLDNETLQLLRDQNTTYNDIQLSGGLYTTCDSGNNYGIFGAITYTRGGITSYVVAGTKLNFDSNQIYPYMANSFQYFDNKVPIGYIYDSYGGIGYIGGILSGHENLIQYLNSGGSINSGFIYSGDTIISNNPNRTTTIQSGNNAMETMRNLIIQGSVGLSKSMDEIERISLLGNFQNKTVIYNGSDINSSTMINVAKQKAQELCQGQEQYPYTNLQPWTENIICVSGQNLSIDLTSNNYHNKTIIVKNGNVILQNGMTGGSSPLNIFIDKGILYLPEPIERETFDNQGFPTIGGTSSGLYLKGNFIINGLMMGGTTGFNHKLHLQGKLTTLNTPLTPTIARIDQVAALLGPGYDGYINLQNVFVRTCGLGGTGSDTLTLCNTNNSVSTTPLVILNGNYPSDILQ